MKGIVMDVGYDLHYVNRFQKLDDADAKDKLTMLKVGGKAVDQCIKDLTREFNQIVITLNALRKGGVDSDSSSPVNSVSRDSCDSDVNVSSGQCKTDGSAGEP